MIDGGRLIDRHSAAGVAYYALPPVITDQPSRSRELSSKFLHVAMTNHRDCTEVLKLLCYNSDFGKFTTVSFNQISPNLGIFKLFSIGNIFYLSIKDCANI